MDHMPLEALYKTRTKKKRPELKPPEPFQLPSRRNTATSAEVSKALPSPPPQLPPPIFEIQDGKDDDLAPSYTGAAELATDTSTLSTSAGSSSTQGSGDVFLELGMDDLERGLVGANGGFSASGGLRIPWGLVMKNISNAILDYDTYYLSGQISSKDWEKTLYATASVHTLVVQGSTLHDGTTFLGKSTALQLFSTKPGSPFFPNLTTLTIDSPHDLHANPFLVTPSLQSLTIINVPDHLQFEVSSYLKALSQTASQLRAVTFRGVPPLSTLRILSLFPKLSHLAIHHIPSPSPSSSSIPLDEVISAITYLVGLRTLGLSLDTLSYNPRPAPSQTQTQAPNQALQVDTLCLIGTSTCLDAILKNHTIQPRHRLGIRFVEYPESFPPPSPSSSSSPSPSPSPLTLLLQNASITELDIRGPLPLSGGFDTWCTDAQRNGTTYPNITRLSLHDMPSMSFNTLPILAEVYPNVEFLAAPIRVEAPAPSALSKRLSSVSGNSNDSTSAKLGRASIGSGGTTGTIGHNPLSSPVQAHRNHPLKILVTNDDDDHKSGNTRQLSVQMVIALARTLAGVFPQLGQLDVQSARSRGGNGNGDMQGGNGFSEESQGSWEAIRDILLFK